MAREAPYWRPMPHAREGLGGHGLLAVLMRNLAEAAAHDPDVLSLVALPRGSHPGAFAMVAELAEVLDDDMSGIVHTLANSAEVDWDRVGASGRSRPTLVLNAHVTTRGNLSITVEPGPLGSDGTHGRRHDWKRFPRGGREAFRRPEDEVALIRGAETLFYGRDLDGPGGVSDFAWATRLNAQAYLSELVTVVWDHCREALSAHYDVVDGFAPALDGQRGDFRKPDRRNMFLAPPPGHVEWHGRQRLLEAAARVEAEARVRPDAEAVLRSYAGDARALVRRWRGLKVDEWAPPGLVTILAAGGVKASPGVAWDRFAAIEGALRIVDPDWEKPPSVAPLAPAPSLPEASNAVEEPVLFFADPVDVEPEPIDVEPEPFALTASRSRTRSTGGVARPVSARVASHVPVEARRPSVAGRSVDVEPEPFSLGITRSRSRSSAQELPSVPSGSRAEVSDRRFYARLPRYAATADELAAILVPSVDALVERVNEGLRQAGRPRVSQGDFPATRSRFERLAALHADLLVTGPGNDSPMP